MANKRHSNKKSLVALKIMKYVKNRNLSSLIKRERKSDSSSDIKYILDKSFILSNLTNRTYLEKTLGYKNLQERRFCIESKRVRSVSRFFKLSRIKIRKNSNLMGVKLIAK